jgi:hypothetical protein
VEGIDIVPLDDAEEVVPLPKHVLFYTLDKKMSIVAEVYAVGNSIKSTARKWLDGATYQIWVQRILAPYAAAHNNKIYLLQDMHSIHLHNNSITALNRLRIEVDFTLTGYTLVMQPMDKGIHKPFKQYIREESNAWMVVHQQGA